jgi:CDP-diacylglycerol--glycerol-3-phosphate 3-phosphatidyltransferase
MRIWFKWAIDPLAAFFYRIGLSPNTMRLLGLAGNFVGAYFVSTGQMTTGGILMLVTTPLDALDGAMARLRGDASDWGAFVDSVTDRYSELAILGGLLYYFTSIGDGLSAIVAFAAAAGTVLVSYVKARAEAVGFDAKVGILTRVERYLVLAPLLVFNQPVWAVWTFPVRSLHYSASIMSAHKRGRSCNKVKNETGESLFTNLCAEAIQVSDTIDQGV